jgi:hypothetical protein
VSPELEQKLYEDFPTLFANRESKGSCMAFGCECGDGWYDILRAACNRIAAHEEYAGEQTFSFTQVKEKYGTLRLYHCGGDSFCNGVVSMAEAMSAMTCERCGRQGRPNDRGWISTLCDGCRK